MKQAVRTYLVQLFSALAVYMIVLFSSVSVVENNEFGSALTAAIVLLPMIPCLFVLRAIITFYRTLDEFKRRIISEAMIAAALITGFASFAYGFLEGALDLPAISMIWVLPALMGSQGIIMAFLKWRYR